MTVHLTCSFSSKVNTQFKTHRGQLKLTSCQQPANEQEPTLQATESLMPYKNVTSLRPLISSLWEDIFSQVSEKSRTTFSTEENMEQIFHTMFKP